MNYSAALTKITHKHDHHYALSQIQQGLLYHAFYGKRPGCYVTHIQVQMNEPVNKTLLESAWSHVIKRYDMLRASLYHNRSGEWFQQIHEPYKCNITVHDLTKQTRKTQKKTIKETLLNDRKKGFTEDDFPLQRFLLFKKSADNHLLLWSHSHIIISGPSAVMILKEAMEYYDKLMSKESISVKYARSYEEYVNFMQKIDLSEAKKYWKTKLSGIEGQCNLENFSSQLNQNNTKKLQARYTVGLTNLRSQYLADIASNCEVTINTIILGAWGIILSQYCDMDDITFGSVRALPQGFCEDLAGVLINTLPIRVKINAERTIREYLCDIRKQQQALRNHTHTPLQKIQKWCELESGNTLFNTFVDFKYQSLTEYYKSLGENWTKRAVYFSNDTNYPLGLEAYFEDHKWQFRFTYHTEYFTSCDIKNFGRQFINVLQSIISDPEQYVTEVSTLYKAQEKILLTKWNTTTTNYPKHKTVTTLFSEQAQKTPTKIAIIHKNKKISYKELENKSTNLSKQLSQLGCGTGTPVVLCHDRNINAIISMLAINKAGGAYVPIDPSHPLNYITSIINDTGATVVLTEDKYNQKLAKIEASKKYTLVKVEDEISKKMARSPSITVPDSADDSLIYIMYTSGSTGRPKGVKIYHHGVVRLVKNTNYIHLDGKEHIAQTSNIAFDTSTFEIWGALLNGGCLDIIENTVILNPDVFCDYLRNNHITTMWLTSALFNQLVTARPDIFKSLSDLLVGGEALDAKIVNKLIFNEKYRPKRLINGYGPTECTTFATFYNIPYNRKILGAVPIGRPIANTEVYILDKWLRPVPAGVIGTLYLGGDGIAEGYLNNRELTSKVFIRSPFTKNASIRLYNTGDRVKWLENGLISYAGRSDEQIKIRGFRIELTAIESALYKFNEVRQCAVIVNKNGRNKIICAYLVAEKDHIINKNHLKEEMLKTLPTYMIPSRFIVLPQLPLTKNGKLDKKALPNPKDESNSTKSPKAAKLSKIEQALCDTWCDVLGIKNINIDDNFFDLGGDSIVSIQMITRLNNHNIHITSEDIFNNQTIKDLTEDILTKSRVKPIKLRRKGSTGDIILSPIQQWFFSLGLEDINYFNQEIEISYNDKLLIDTFKQAFEISVDNFDGFKIRFQYNRGKNKWLSYYTKNNSTASYELKTYHIPSEYKHNEPAWVKENQARLHNSVDISAGPVVIVSIYCGYNSNVTKIRIIAHHLIMDGVSWRIFTDVLSNTYQDLSTKGCCKLHKPQATYKDWCEALQKHVTAFKKYPEEKYWNTQVKGLKFEQQKKQLMFSQDLNTVIKLNKQSTTKSIAVELTKNSTESLLTSCNEIYHTNIEDLLLSALMLSMAKRDNQNKYTLYFDHESHGRDKIDHDINTTYTVGWFTCIKPIKLCVSSTEDIGSVIKSVKEQLRSIPNAGIGYGLIQSYGRNKLEQHDCPQFVFNYLGQFNQSHSKDKKPTFNIDTLELKSSPNNRRGHALEMNSLIVNHQLKISLSYSQAIHTYKVIHHFMKKLQTNIERIIKHCLTQENRAYTPSDFPLANLSQNKLDNLVKRYDTNTIDDIYPLSPIQDGILFHYLLKPYTEDYIVQAILQFDNEINSKYFNEAWNAVCNHYAIFKSSFIFNDVQQPMQVVSQQAKLEYNTIDLTNLSQNRLATKIQQLIKADRQKGFDLTKPPLMRITLLKIANNQYKCIICFHHIILGGWSLALTIRAVLEYYQQRLKNIHPTLPRHTPYCEFIKRVTTQNTNDARNYWKNLLVNVTPKQLSIENNLTKAPEYKEADHEKQHLIINHNQTSAYRNFANQQRITMNTFIQGALGIVLCRYSMSNDITIGATSSGRPTAIKDVETMVGLIINTLPVLIQIEKKQTAIEYLQSLQLQGIKTRQHEHSSLTDIRRWCGIPGTEQLFDILFIYENYPFDYNKMHKLGCSDITINERTHYKLTFTVTQKTELTITADYDPYYYQAADVLQLLQYIEHTLDAILAAPTSPINCIRLHDVLSSKMLNEYNNTFKKILPNQTVINQFVTQQAQSPAHLAICYQNQKLSYGELYQQARSLAQGLMDYGIGKKDIVAICLCRNINNVIAQLAIQLLSAAYLNLDPNNPSKRLNDILCDSKTHYLITDNETIKKISSIPYASSLKIINVDTSDMQSIKTTQLPSISIDHRDTAYVLYTSGTTGKPKGVMITHGALTNFLLAMKDLLNATNPENVLAITPFTFDISGLELYLPLITGGTIVLADNNIMTNPQLLNTILKDNDVTLMQTTPALWQILQNNNWVNESNSLRKILCGGEALPSTLAQYLKDQCQSLWNVYGPTETTIWSTAYEILNINEQYSYVSIGRPIANTQIFILDNDLNPLSHGITGELYIGGAGLAKEYINQPQLTKTCFVDIEINPNTKLQRLYKTGDLARWNADGQLEYKGRIDHQIKLHGLRIELAEIEQQLRKAPGVSECVVIKSDDQTNPYLIAYIVLNKQHKTTKTSSHSYREYLQTYLPKYMVPSQIFVIDELPLNANNKVDRKALPTPKSTKNFLDKQVIKPTTPTECTVAEIWSDVLAVNKVDISTSNSFFDLGGDSFSAIQVIGQIQQALSSKVKLSDLLQTENLHELANLIDKYQQSGKFNITHTRSDTFTNSLIPLQSKGKKLPLFLIHPIGGTVFCYRPLVHHIGTDRPIYAIQDPGIDTNNLLFKSLDEMASSYLKMIKQHQPNGPYLLAGASFGANVAIEIARQLETNGDEVLFTGSIDGWALYPAKVNNDQTWFETHLSRQHKKFNRLATTAPKLPKTLIKLNWHRQQMLANYRIPEHQYDIILFKSMEVFPVFEPIESELNHWDSVSGANTRLIPVPGNHETMLEEPHVKVLAESICACLKQLDS